MENPRKYKTDAELKKELVAVFSKFIRFTYANENGFVKCYTCDAIKFWKEIQNGHYISRRFLAVAFDERNCRPQCWGCNAKHMGNGMSHVFGPKLQKEYGMGIIDELNRLAKPITKYFPYREKIDYYKLKNEELMLEKRL